MKLENQVVSLDIAKKLKELRVKQESLFYWYKNMGQVRLAYKGDIRLSNESGKEVLYHSESHSSYQMNDVCSAFTVAELGEMLLKGVTLNIRIYDYGRGYIDYLDGTYTEEWRNNGDGGCISEADARGLMLVYLIENKLMEVSKE